MKQILRTTGPAILAFTLILGSCTKNDNPLIPDDSEVAVQADDGTRFAYELDALVADGVTLLELEQSFSGDNQILDQPICDATVQFNTQSDPMTITVTYDGSNCAGGRIRTGTVTFSMEKGKSWKEAGTVVTVTLQDVRITRVSDGKYFTLNGTHTFENVSGGLVINLPNELDSVVHHIRGNDFSVTFENGSQHTWNFARKRVLTFQNGLVATVTGLAEEGGKTDVVDWGMSRFGVSFISTIDEPVVLRQSCGFRVTAGVMTHSTQRFRATVTFGLNQNGEPTDCPGADPFYYRLEWLFANIPLKSLLIPY